MRALTCFTCIVAGVMIAILVSSSVFVRPRAPSQYDTLMQPSSDTYFGC